jgi:hypothetical protein
MWKHRIPILLVLAMMTALFTAFFAADYYAPIAFAWFGLGREPINRE